MMVNNWLIIITLSMFFGVAMGWSGYYLTGDQTSDKITSILFGVVAVILLAIQSFIVWSSQCG